MTGSEGRPRRRGRIRRWCARSQNPAHAGDTHGDTHGVAQAAHGSAPDIAGHDVANPSALVLSVAMLLDWLGDRHDRDDLRAPAASLRNAVDGLLAAPATRTAELGAGSAPPRSPTRSTGASPPGRDE